MSLLFFIKPSTITVDCLTSNVMAYEMARIDSAIKFVPEWWKNLSRHAPSVWGEHSYVRDGTLKLCSGFIDLYKSGFILPMWCDLAVDIGPIGTNDYRYQYSDFYSSAVLHAEEQRGEFCKDKNYQHLKLTSPWFLVCKNSVNWVFMDVVWNDVNLLPYRTLTGVVNYKYVSGTHINIMFKRETTTQQIFIPYKTPMAHLIPITEKQIKLKYHLVDEITLDKKTTNKKLGVKFVNRLRNLKNETKCPFPHK